MPTDEAFALKKVKRVEMRMLGGNDTISVNNTKPVFADMGAGNDFVNLFGPATATVLGGKGSDVLTGSDAAESFDGGAGFDSIRGAGGNDTITGGGGFDQLFGERAPIVSRRER